MLMTETLLVEFFEEEVHIHLVQMAMSCPLRIFHLQTEDILRLQEIILNK